MKTLLIMQLYLIIKISKAANLCDNEVVYYLSSIKDDVWILLLLKFNYETKYKSSHIA